MLRSTSFLEGLCEEYLICECCKCSHEISFSRKHIIDIDNVGNLCYTQVMFSRLGMLNSLQCKLCTYVLGAHNVRVICMLCSYGQQSGDVPAPPPPQQAVASSGYG